MCERRQHLRLALKDSIHHVAMPPDVFFIRRPGCALKRWKQQQTPWPSSRATLSSTNLSGNTCMRLQQQIIYLDDESTAHLACTPCRSRYANFICMKLCLYGPPARSVRVMYAKSKSDVVAKKDGSFKAREKKARPEGATAPMETDKPKAVAPAPVVAFLVPFTSVPPLTPLPLGMHRYIFPWC